MQFLNFIALAAALSLRAEPNVLNEKGTHDLLVHQFMRSRVGKGGKGGKGDGPPPGDGLPPCIADCEPDPGVCHPDCDTSDCDPAILAIIAQNCGAQDGPPDCVADCEPDPGTCHPDCDKTNCSADDMAVIDGHCSDQSDDTNNTVITDPLDNQLDVNVANDMHDAYDSMEDCSDADCSPIVVENCKKLWDAKLKVCAEHAEEWAYTCEAPTYNGHNCKRGCCSEVAQDVQDGDGSEMPSPDEMWEYMSGDDDTITREELAGGFTVMLPPVLGPYVENFTDCMMMAYDVSGDGTVNETEFKDAFGQHFEICLQHTVPADVLQDMANHGDDDYDDYDPEEEWKFIAGDDGKASVEDIAVAISRDIPPFEPYAMELSQCLLDQVDTDGDGEVSYDEFVDSDNSDHDPMEPCMHEHIPDDVWAQMAVGQDEHWCDYTDPEEEDCCKLSSHEEQDECYDQKMADAHYCDFTGPEEEPCCAETSREAQESCLEGKDIHVLGQKKRKTHLLNNKVRSSFRRFVLKRFIRTKKSSKKARLLSSKEKHVKKVKHVKKEKPVKKEKHVKTLKGSKHIKLSHRLVNKLSSNPMKLKAKAHSK